MAGLQDINSALIVGAGGGIGLALVRRLIQDVPECKVFATLRNPTNSQQLAELQKSNPDRLFLIGLDAGKDSDYENLFREIKTRAPKIDLLINCIGFLHDNQSMPEKRLSDVTVENLYKAFTANSLPVVLLAKHLFPLFKNQELAAFVSLSARVGSISDNRSGGWYSYRSTKSAHNMFIKNIALEMERFRCHTVVAALHPGTTKTRLSAPFIANTKYQLHEPDGAARNILAVVLGLTMKDSGGFFDWKGEKIPW